MAEVYKELDEVKSELERLKEDCRIKTELSESLRRAYTEQQTKCQQANLKIEKQEKELNVKSEECVELRQLYDEVKFKLQETELSLKQVTSVNEKLRTDGGEKVQRLEGENRKMVSALEAATTRSDDLEQKLHACNEEIDGLKGRLSELQRKCFEAEEKARAGKELRCREDVIMKLEEQSMSVQDQLKWKKEQFQHLEEAHRRLQDQFQLSKKEWEFEKSAMLSEMTMLQSKLDSQIRITESLESQLKMCNQALAYEESRRKSLEVQLSESKQCFENVVAEYEDAKEKFESLSVKRDEDIADLRNCLGMKEASMKEMEYRVTYLELENKELLGTVKELQEAQINRRKVDPSTTKLRNKLKELEKAHSKCFSTLEEKELEWNSKMEKLIEDMKSYESDVKRQNEQMDLLKTQLDHCHSTIEVSGEETSILFMVLKSELSDVYSKLYNLENQTEALCEKNGKTVLVSDENLETGDSCSPVKAKSCLKQARMEIASLTEKLKLLKLLEQRGNMLESALEEHKKMLEESTRSQICLKEQVSQMEAALRNVSTALEKSNNALTAKMSEVSQAETELLLWKSKAESFKICLEQSQEVCKKLETSVLEQVEIEKGLRKANEVSQCNLKEQEQRINDLQQKIFSLNKMLEQKEATAEETKLELAKSLEKEGHLVHLVKERDAVVESLEKELKGVHSANLEAQSNFECEKEELCRIIKNQNEAVENLGKVLEVLKQESATTELERIEAKIIFEHEKEELSRVISEKDETIRGLHGLASIFEQDFDEAFLFFLFKDVESHVHLCSHQEALTKTEFDMKVEMEKNSAIDLLKMEVNNLGDKILLHENSLLQSNKLVKELEVLAEGRKLEMEKLTRVFEEDRAKLKVLVEELENENKVATDNVNSLSSERESLLVLIEGVYERFGDLCMQDVELDGMLAKMMQNSAHDFTLVSDVEISGKVNAPEQKHIRKDIAPRVDRSPLRERNQ